MQRPTRIPVPGDPVYTVHGQQVGIVTFADEYAVVMETLPLGPRPRNGYQWSGFPSHLTLTKPRSAGE